MPELQFFLWGSIILHIFLKCFWDFYSDPKCTLFSTDSTGISSDTPKWLQKTILLIKYEVVYITCPLNSWNSSDSSINPILDSCFYCFTQRPDLDTIEHYRKSVAFYHSLFESLAEISTAEKVLHWCKH